MNLHRASLMSKTSLVMVMIVVCCVAPGGVLKAVPASAAVANQVVSAPTSTAGVEMVQQEFTQHDLRRWAKSGLERAGRRQERVGSVTIVGKFPDGSYVVDVMREGGTVVRGRLYKDRARYKIAFDRSNLGILEVDVRNRNNGRRSCNNADVIVRRALRETSSGAALHDDDYGSELLNSTLETGGWADDEY
ncbi:MAG: hypothetical protein MJ025_00320 [Victivallaceae bacterium]|nr:hypothetical protein [Victivallaceae bacterium]